MIITGGILVAIGVAVLLGSSFWPMLLIGRGAGIVLSGVMGRSGWEPLEGHWGRRHGKWTCGHKQDPSTSDESA